MTAHDIALSIHFNPYVSAYLLVALGTLALVPLLLFVLQKRKIPFLRALLMAAFICVLANPSTLTEKREPVKNIGIVLVDESESQDFLARRDTAQTALDAIEKSYARSSDIDLRIVKTSAGKESSRTELFSALRQAQEDIPEMRRAGVIMITDGQAHDVPDPKALNSDTGPVHVILTGRRDEKDRRIAITDLPAFGIVGKTITVKYRVEDAGGNPAPDARITLRKAGEQPEVFFVPVGETQTLELPVEHAGQNVFEISTEALENELTPVNNRAAIEFQGVRDRLRVLLVSGRPHAGGRTWRDLLTADPGVDLVHFTILRDPEKIDATPSSELSLIAFPFRELFEIKLYDFDLIIFDRYSHNEILPVQYFENIARYVNEGGAFLEASGPDYVGGKTSVYNTPLRDILPGSPTGKIYNEPFIPQISAKGRAHPVTRELLQDTPWGAWLRQVGIQPLPGADTLINGAHDLPLLVLNRQGEGRVAQIASDQIWLWARGYEGGGPYAELLRRTVHWLMKEPELDERALQVSVNGKTITARKPSFVQQQETIKVTFPDATHQDLELNDKNNGYLENSLSTTQTGIYEFKASNGETRFAVSGQPDSEEFRDVIATEKKIAPIVEKTGGGLFWTVDGLPSFRTSGAHDRAHGNNWLALRNNDAYSVVGATEKPLLPVGVSVALLLGLLLLTWWQEGRKR